MRAKYLSLGAGELTAAAVFTLTALAAVAPRMDGRGQVALWSALVPLLVVLVQGGAYWLLARRWVLRGRMPLWLAVLYRGFRAGDVVVLSAGLGGVVVCWPSSPTAAVLVVAIWLFGLVEWVNYFVVRLAYPVGSWLGSVGQWRTPRIVRDLRTLSAGPRAGR